jgi:biotin operon repressor
VKPAGHLKNATEDELRELERIAVQEHAHLDLDEPHDIAIQIRVQNLARERGLSIPGASHPRESPRKPHRKGGPNYLQAGLEQSAQQCAKERRQKRLQKHIKIIRRNKDRFYLFCFLKGGFAREMRNCRALEVLTAIIEQLSGDVETWVSIETLAERLGRTAKTVSKALRALEERGIITLTNAADRYYSLHGRLIRKNQGYVIQLHVPMIWDWKSVGGVPEKMKKYLADYEDEAVDNSETPVTVTGVPR